MKDRKIYSAIAALTLLSAAVNASASTGSINFTGSVEDTTCSVTGMTQTVDFPRLTVSELQPLVNYAVPAQVPVEINIEDCPSNNNTASLTVLWTGAAGHANRMNLGTTDMRGAAVVMGTRVGTDTGTVGMINSGTTRNINLTAGRGSITLYPSLFRATGGQTGAANVVAGDFSTEAQLTMTIN